MAVFEASNLILGGSVGFFQKMSKRKH